MQSAPFDPAKLFGRRAPIEVEIGSGKGGFALDYAAAHPTIDLIAIEIRHKFANLTKEKQKTRGLRNLLILNGDAKQILPLFPKNSVDVFHIQFPDPWWKRRHHDRRLIQNDFGILLYDLLKIDGLIDLRTDVELRGKEMAELLEAVGFVNCFEKGMIAPFDVNEIPSTRERTYIARGQSVFRYKLRRTSEPPHKIGYMPTSVYGEQRRR